MIVGAAGDAPLIVLGMHRSGTSLVSHWLQESGLFLGAELYSASPFNRGGYFEDVDFIRLNQSMLSRLGQHSSGHELPLERQHAPTLEMMEDLAAFVDARRQSTPWGWKDPRTCLLLDLYRAVCPDARYLIVLRDFAPIVQSLILRERVLQSRLARLARGKFLRWPLQRHHERKFTDHYLAVTSRYFEELLAHAAVCPDRCVVLDLNRFAVSGEALAAALAKLGVALDPVPVTDVLRPSELSGRRDLRFATPGLLTQVQRLYADLMEKAL